MFMNWLLDVRYGLRMLRRSPAFTVTAVLILGLGIGANTAIFTLINAAIWQQLPVRDPGRLVLFYDGVSTGTYSGTGYHNNFFSYPFWQYLHDHQTSFEELCAFRQGEDGVTLQLPGASGSGHREQTTAHLVSGNYFKVLGVPAAVGRVLTAADESPAAPPVAVLSYNLWKRRFQMDASIVGRPVELNGAPYTIVGVAASGFFGERIGSAPGLWLPLTHQAAITQRDAWLARQDFYWLNMMGRLKPGVTPRQAEVAQNTAFQQFYTSLAGGHPSAELLRQIAAARIELKPGGRGISWVRSQYSEPLRLLMAVVGLVLLIACANVATLLLARASTRRHELLTRLALGASRGHILRQILTESLLLAMLGAVAGIAFAWWGVRLLMPMVRVPSVLTIRPDATVLGFTVAISIVTGLAFGLLPALRASGIKSQGRFDLHVRGADRSRFQAADSLVVLQVGLSFALLAAAGLLTRSILELDRQNLGFQRENLLLVKTDPRADGILQPELPALYRQLEDRLNALPGVISATIARHSPISGHSSSGNFSLQGITPPPGKDFDVFRVQVGPRFFETVGIPLLLGRPIDTRDTPSAPSVAVVSESFVKEFLPNQNPIGRRFSLGSPFRSPGIEIVGVAADSKYYTLRDKPKPMAFFAGGQGGSREPYLGEMLIRTSRDPGAAAAQVRQAIRSVDSRLTVLSVTTLEAQVSDALSPEALMSKFCGFFGLLALVLAAIGLYGTLAYAVARRTNEIGIRMALGARRADVLWMVLRQSVILVAFGLAIGLPLALVSTRWIRSYLFGVSPTDPLGIGAPILLLTAVSALAAYLPARRATKVDPMVALRYE